jgi:protein arginine kinase
VLDNLRNSLGDWLRGGPEDDVVVSSRVRLARNVSGRPFLAKASREEIADIEEMLRTTILSCGLRPGLTYYRLDKIGPLERQLLVERHLTAREHAEAHWARGVAFCPREQLSLMVNEEDHLRIQAIFGGFRPVEAWEDARKADEALAEVVPFAFSARYGYLTACPTNVGTAMRVSVMCHLPGLVTLSRMDRVIELAQRRSLVLRGRYGEGTHASADLYQVSNHVTLGAREEEILERVSEGASELLACEREARRELMTERRDELKARLDHVLAFLKSASSISSEEALQLLSQLLLGVYVGLITHIEAKVLGELLLLTLPAHLQTIEGRRLDSAERNELRASYVKARLNLN